jgi:3-hydroxyisobutyrate dehydrogenase
MGTGMARRLLGAGLPLTVYNRNAERAASLVAEGAKLAASAREAAAHADIIHCMVADDTASRAMWLGEHGALGAAKNAVLIDSSTLSVGWVRELSEAAAKHGSEFIDAPVTGTKPHAANGELTFLVGGSAATLEKVRPALAVMSKTITHLGPVGSGALLKLINNFVCGVQVVALAEALALIERSGLDRAKALEILVNGAPGSPLVKVVSARMTTPDFTPNFMLKHLTKDLRYAVTEGAGHGVPLTTAAAAIEVLQKALVAGHGDSDMAAVVELLRKR